MRMLFGLLMLTVVPATHCHATPDRKPLFSLTLSALTPSVESGSQVHLKVVMKNLSDHDLNYSLCYSNGLDRAYEYDVRDSHGKALAILTRKHSEIGPTFKVWPAHLVKPGETDSSGGVISTFYDMTQPGEYTVQVSRAVSDNPKDGVVRSNKITVTIIRPLVSSTQTQHYLIELI
jgi:hypothetical protein